jgi:hypothetical protein
MFKIYFQVATEPELTSVKWSKWGNITQTRQNKEGKVVVQSKKVLLDVAGTYQELLEEICTQLQNFSTHIFIARWQYKQFNNLKDALPADWLLTIVDFAENYRCVHQDEIAAAYYQYKQATIHPVQAYYMCPEEGCTELVKEAVVFISDDLLHDKHAVLAFERKLHEHMVDHNVSWNHHVQFSDGCPSQYKSRPCYTQVAKAEHC